MKLIKIGVVTVVAALVVACGGGAKNEPAKDDATAQVDNAAVEDSLKLAAGTYSNENLGYSIVYPKDILTLQEGAENANEQVFLPKEGKAKLRIYKDERKDKSGKVLTFNEAFDADKRTSKDRQISYNSLQPLFYAISGVEGKEIFYQKTIMAKDALVTAKLTYTKEEKPTYDAMIESLFGSFK